MHQQISHGTLDSPSWGLIRTSKLAARIYAPLGTHMSLGDHVRVVRTFLDAFKSVEVKEEDKRNIDRSFVTHLETDLKVSFNSDITS